jgi:hypothetical protein
MTFILGRSYNYAKERSPMDRRPSYFLQTVTFCAGDNYFEMICTYQRGLEGNVIGSKLKEGKP